MSKFNKIQKYTNINYLKKNKSNRDVMIFFIFLLVSALFWLLNALSEPYSATFTIPVKYVNVPEDEAIVEKSHDLLILKVRGGGYTILRQKISKTFSFITIDASRLIRTNDEGRAFLLPHLQRENIQRQLYIGLEHESIEPDTLFVSISKMKRKNVIIRPNGDIKPDQQFLVSGPVMFTPDSIEIFGPVNIVDTMTYIQTEYFVFDKVRDPVIHEITLKEPNDISLSSKKALMTIPIELFSEKSVFVPVTSIGLADSLIIKTFPSEIKITYQAGLSRFEQIKPSDFKVIVDTEPIFNSERPARLRVRIDKTPEYLHSYDYAPYFVEYLLEKKH